MEACRYLKNHPSERIEREHFTHRYILLLVGYKWKIGDKEREREREIERERERDRGRGSHFACEHRIEDRTIIRGVQQLTVGKVASSGLSLSNRE